MIELLLGCVCSYLLGSIPFALLLVRCLAGVDVRKVGSGNVGATNASRVFGKRSRYLVFLLIYALDFGKGFLPTFWACPEVGTAVLWGSCAILGHCTSPFLGFKGGKGVATTTGVFAVLSWPVLCISLGVFFLVLFATKQVYMGSLAIGLTLVVGAIITQADWPVLLLSLLVSAFLFYTHRSNIRGARCN